jgi:hypothetical protein
MTKSAQISVIERTIDMFDKKIARERLAREEEKRNKEIRWIIHPITTSNKKKAVKVYSSDKGVIVPPVKNVKK